MCRKLFLLTSVALVLALAFTNVAFGNVIERRVAASSDDAEEHVLEDGKMEGLSSSDLELGYESGTSLQTIGIRLLDIQIPQGATITSAWVQFDADDIDNDYHVLDVSLIIEGEGSPNPVTFSSNAGDITSRLVTTASVVWDIPQWMVKHGQGPEEQTPDISAIIQEIVNQPDWAPGNAIVLLFRDNPDKPSAGTREAESFDGTPEAAALLHIEYTEAAAPAGANIIWVTETCDDDLDGIQDDQVWIDWLAAEGHTVDVRPDYWLELDLEPGKVDELNAADLVIISRSSTSGGYDDGDEPALWNSVTSPLMTLSAYLVRTNRWLWMNTDSVEHADAILMALDTTHPLFDGVTFEMGNMVVFLDNTVGTGLSTFVVGTDVGNGTLIAQALGNDWAWIAEWPAGVEFYAGCGQTAGGPRMLFVAGTEEIEGATPQGAYNLTAEGEKVFRNAINYMLPAAPPKPGPAPVGHWQFDEGSGTVAADSSGSGLDGTISGAEWVTPGWDGIGSCLDFDGLGTDRVSLGTFDVIGDGISIACWYKADNLDTPGSDPRMFSKAIGGSSQDHWFMVSSSRVGGEKRLRFRLKTDGDTGELKAGPDGTIELDVWTHVVASWDGEAMRLHKNGVEVGNTAKAGTLSTDPTAKVSIGNQPEGVGDRPFDGLIDDVRVYNLALSEAEIDAIVSGQ